MSRPLPPPDTSASSRRRVQRARVDLPPRLRDRLRERADRAGVSLSAALQVAVEQALEMNSRQFTALARKQARRSRPPWWRLLCEDLEKRKRRGEPITTREGGRGAKNEIIKVDRLGGYIVLKSERSLTGIERTFTVGEIVNPGTANKTMLDRLRAHGEDLLRQKKQGGPRE